MLGWVLHLENSFYIMQYIIINLSKMQILFVFLLPKLQGGVFKCSILQKQTWRTELMVDWLALPTTRSIQIAAHNLTSKIYFQA